MACSRVGFLSRWTEATLLIGLLALLGSAFTYATGSWTQIGPEGGQVTALAIDPLTPSTVYAGTRGGVFRSLNGGDNWAPTNTGLTNLDVMVLAIDPITPSTLYAGTRSNVFRAGTQSGVFRSLDGGSSWANTGLSDNNVQALAIDPITPSTLYAGTKNGVFRSLNKGDNWAPINTGLTNLDVMVLAIDPITPTTLYAGTQSGVFRSLDGGDNWASINTGLAVSSVQALAIDPLTPSTLYAVTFAGVFKSLDGGNSWIESGLAFRSVQALAIDPLTPSTLYAATCCSSSTIGVYRSLDGGTSWALFNTGLANLHVLALAIDPVTPSTLYAGTQGGVFRILDGGDNWAPMSTGLTNLVVQALAIDPVTPSTLYAGTGSGVFRSLDGGNTWSNTGLNDSLVQALAIDPITPSTLYAGTIQGGVFRSLDGGDSWVSTGLSSTFITITALAIDPITPSTLYAGTQSGVFRSLDGGDNWVPINTGLASLDVLALAIDPVTPTTLYTGTRSDGLYRTLDGGDSWIKTSLTSRFVGAVAIDPVTPSTLYAGGARSLDGGDSWVFNSQRVDGLALAIDPLTPSTLYAGGTGVFRSLDGADNWAPIAIGLTNFSVQALAIDPVTPSTLYAGTRGGVFRSLDGGGSWAAMSTGLTNLDVLALAIDPVTPSTLYAGTFNGIFRSLDGGGSWRPINTGLTNLNVLALAIDPVTPSTLYAGTQTGLGTGTAFRSLDGGETWKPMNIPSRFSVRALAIDPVTPSTLYAGVEIFAASCCTDERGVYRSLDGGDSWVKSGLTDLSVFALAIDPLTPSTLYAGIGIYDGAGDRGVYQSLDGGNSWAKTGLNDLFVGTLAIDPLTPSTLYAGTQSELFQAGTRSGVFRSLDGGNSWASTSLNDQIVPALAIDPITPTTLYAGTQSDGVHRSTDGGNSWVPINTGLTNLDVLALAIDPVKPIRLYGGTFGNGVFVTEFQTVLIANFTNGNDGAVNSRIYLWNPSQSAGDVTVRVFTLPLGGGTAQELTVTPLSLGSLGAKSARNVKLAEDILVPLGITLPYTDNDGDLTLEFTIQATDVRGVTQVFSSSFAYGTNPLQEIPSTASTSPTVLVANFMNGNDAVFNSRVYLFNPSANPGEVTARVFSLPLTSGVAQELTAAPLNLGSLGANSAMNIRLAENILIPLGIQTPYTTDGGNLTVEFTVQTANVRGAAQVFSSNFAFGVYPLQVIPSTSSGTPTVLAANFMNGNNNAFNSRVYLWNPSTNSGEVTVRVFTLPLTGGLPQELTATPLVLGTLGAKSALNVKLAEDVLAPLGITLPYISDGGNLILEFTIQATDVRGVTQVFSSSFAYGTNPLQEIPSTASISPTVLVANFMNGNDAAFNSRVYLWNPSESAGDVTVRVFTLPLTSGLAQELTATSLALGTLGARSALNIKLAEDILIPLGIQTPYTTDGGNLTVEFTVQAPNVRGAAQVFSGTFGFGTYPLEVIR